MLYTAQRTSIYTQFSPRAYEERVGCFLARYLRSAG
jgi:hypothetical protein